MHNSPTTPVDPAELRPRKRWFWIAGIIGAVGLILGVGGGVGLFVYGATSLTPDARMTLTDKGQGHGAGPVLMTSAQEWAVFSTSDSSWEITCTATGPNGPARVSGPEESVHFTTNGQTWHEVARIDAPAAGRYQVSCGPSRETASADLTTAQYLVGEAPSLGAVFGGMFGGFAVLFGVPFVAIVAGTIIAIVTGVKRGNHRKRLMAERHGPPPGPAAYGGPPPPAGPPYGGPPYAG